MQIHLNKVHILLIALIALLSVVLVASIGGTVAYLNSRTAPQVNEFVPASVTCAVEEQFEDGMKQFVKVRNTGNIDAYIRATVVVTFVDENGKVSAVAPIEGTDYTVIWANGLWKQGSDGYWYYASPVASGEVTGDLIEMAQPVSVPEGFRLNIQIVATAIQAQPDEAVQGAWGVTVADGKINPR